jgi:hypothetical protein
MGFSARGRWSSSESNPPIGRLREILRELDIETGDFEHPDVSLKHETEWCLSAFHSGRLIWENVGDGDEDDADKIKPARHMKGMSRQKVLELWLKLAAGNIAMVEAEPWLPGLH